MKDDGIAENAIEVARAMIAKTDTQERYEMSQKFLKKIGASLPQEKKEILSEDPDLINFLEQEPKGMDIDNASAFLQAREAEKKKRIRKSAHDQREELEVDTSEKTNNEILSIGLEGLSKKERHYQAPISFNIRGYLLALYHHLADRKAAKEISYGLTKYYRSLSEIETQSLSGSVETLPPQASLGLIESNRELRRNILTSIEKMAISEQFH